MREREGGGVEFPCDSHMEAAGHPQNLHASLTKIMLESRLTYNRGPLPPPSSIRLRPLLKIKRIAPNQIDSPAQKLDHHGEKIPKKICSFHMRTTEVHQQIHGSNGH